MFRKAIYLFNKTLAKIKSEKISYSAHSYSTLYCPFENVLMALANIASF